MPRRKIASPSQKASPRVTRSRAASAGLTVANTFATPPKITSRKRKGSTVSQENSKRPRLLNPPTPAATPSPPAITAIAIDVSPKLQKSSSFPSALFAASAPASSTASTDSPAPVGLLRRLTNTASSILTSPFRRRSGTNRAPIELPPPVPTIQAQPTLTVAESPAIVEPVTTVVATPQVSDSSPVLALSSPVLPPSPTPGPKVQPTFGMTFTVPELSDDGMDIEHEERPTATEPPRASSPGRTYGLVYSSDSETEDSRYDFINLPVIVHPYDQKPQSKWTQLDYNDYMRYEHGWDPDALEKAAHDMRQDRVPDLIVAHQHKMMRLEQDMIDEIEKRRVTMLKKTKEDVEQQKQLAIQEAERYVNDVVYPELYQKALKVAREDARKEVDPEETRLDARQEVADTNSIQNQLQSLLPFVKQHNDELKAYLEEKVYEYYRTHTTSAPPNVFAAAAAQKSDPVWTQPPPASPTPAHAQLPASSTPSSSSKTTITWAETLNLDSPEKSSPPKYSTHPATALPPAKSALKPAKTVAPEETVKTVVPEEPPRTPLTDKQQKSYDKILSEVNKYTPKQPSRLRQESRASTSSAANSSPLSAGIAPSGPLEQTHTNDLNTQGPSSIPLETFFNASQYTADWASVPHALGSPEPLQSDPAVRAALSKIDYSTLAIPTFGNVLSDENGFVPEEFIIARAAASRALGVSV